MWDTTRALNAAGPLFGEPLPDEFFVEIREIRVDLILMLFESIVNRFVPFCIRRIDIEFDRELGPLMERPSQTDTSNARSEHQPTLGLWCKFVPVGTSL